LYPANPSAIGLEETTNTNIKNNIFFDIPGQTVYLVDNQSKIGLDIGYNCIFRSDGKQPPGSPSPHDLWQVDPIFVNPAADDFHLLPSSPAIDKGITLSNVLDDFEGKPRPQGNGYDMGAYER
jgi:hypothetical protein